MAIAYVTGSGVSAQNTGGTTLTTGSVDTTGANFLAVTITSDGGAANFTSLTDSKGNTWQTALDWTHGSVDWIRIMYAENPTVGTGHTFTVTYGALTFIVVCAAGYSGMNTSATIDKTATGTGTSTSLLTSATATTAQADELLICAGTISAGTNTTFTQGTSFNMRTQQGNASVGTVGFLEDRIVSATGTYTGSAAWGGSSGAWVCGLATFKGSAGGGATIDPGVIYGSASILGNPFFSFG